GSFDDTTTFFGEITLSGDGVELEHGIVIFNDLLFGKHAMNFRVGKTVSTISSFGAHSSYVADALIAPLGVTALYGSTTDSWAATNQYPGVELNGVIAYGRLDWSLGFNAGSNLDVRNSESVYAHVGGKIGGLR